MILDEKNIKFKKKENLNKVFFYYFKIWKYIETLSNLFH